MPLRQKGEIYLTVKQNEKGLWDVQFYYKDWTGKRIKKHKRNFKTKREAVAWTNQFIMQQSHNLNMDFRAFWEIYRNDMKERLRENTMRSKDFIIELKILPYFGDKNISEISPADVREWQNMLLKNGYAQTYLRTVNNQLSCIFNYAMKYYDLPRNPCRQAGTIGKSRADEMNFWTQDEFEQFISCMEDKPVSHCGFMILYWTGCRIGDDDDKIRLNQRKPSKYKGLSRFGPEKNLQRINKFMKERPTFYKKLIQMKENFRFYLRCFYCITKVVILQFNSEKQDRISS